MKRAVFPGSFSPFTKGHEDIVTKALPLFDEIIVSIGFNSSKSYMFSIEERMKWIKSIYKDNPKIRVETYEGLTVDFCKKIKADYIVRGLRNPIDFVKEQELAKINKKLCPEIETVFILSSPEFETVSSTFVRELWVNSKDYSEYLSYKLPQYN